PTAGLWARQDRRSGRFEMNGPRAHETGDLLVPDRALPRLDRDRSDHAPQGVVLAGRLADAARAGLVGGCCRRRGSVSRRANPPAAHLQQTGDQYPQSDPSGDSGPPAVGSRTIVDHRALVPQYAVGASREGTRIPPELLSPRVLRAACSQNGNVSSIGLAASSWRNRPIRSATRFVSVSPLAAVAARGSPAPELVVSRCQ